jgi:hypothetical protein
LLAGNKDNSEKEEEVFSSTYHILCIRHYVLRELSEALFPEDSAAHKMSLHEPDHKNSSPKDLRSDASFRGEYVRPSERDMMKTLFLKYGETSIVFFDLLYISPYTIF